MGGWEHEAEFKKELERFTSKGSRTSIARAAELAVKEHAVVRFISCVFCVLPLVFNRPQSLVGY